MASNPPIHGKPPFVPASKLVNATAEALTNIKTQDHLTWADIGEALGKSDDQAAKYDSGFATMDFTTWLRACSLWGNRFSAAASMLGLSIMQADQTLRRADIQRGMLTLTLVLADLQSAMLDGEMDDAELAAMERQIDQAHQFLEAMRLRLARLKVDRAIERNGR